MTGVWLVYVMVQTNSGISILGFKLFMAGHGLTQNLGIGGRKNRARGRGESYREVYDPIDWVSTPNF